MTEEIVYTLSEWGKKAAMLFGDNPRDWKFKCPSCGHIQSIGDFQDLNLIPGVSGIDPNWAYYDCIGRYDPRVKTVGEMLGKIQPCNYTSGGLFNINKIKVIRPNGQAVYVFDFATSQTKGQGDENGPKE